MSQPELCTPELCPSRFVLKTAKAESEGSTAGRQNTDTKDSHQRFTSGCRLPWCLTPKLSTRSGRPRAARPQVASLARTSTQGPSRASSAPTTKPGEASEQKRNARATAGGGGGSRQASGRWPPREQAPCRRRAGQRWAGCSVGPEAGLAALQRRARSQARRATEARARARSGPTRSPRAGVASERALVWTKVTSAPLRPTSLSLPQFHFRKRTNVRPRGVIQAVHCHEMRLGTLRRLAIRSGHNRR